MFNPLSRASFRLELPSSFVATRHRTFNLILLMLVAAFPGFGQETVGTVRLEVTIRAYGAQLPSVGVMVKVLTQDDEIAAQGLASSSGHFSFDVVKRICHVIVTADGFETSEQTVDLTRTANIAEVVVDLVPKRKTESLLAPPALSDAKASKNAQKEFEKGDSALNARKLDEALNHLDKAVRDSPCYARAQTELATVLAERQRMSEAEAAARKARECDPDFIEAYLQLGMILNTENKFAEGEATLQEGIRRAPAQWQFYYQLATAHYGQKDFTKAEQDYQRVLSLNASPPAELRVKLADVYLKENNYEKAYAQMQEYLKAEPEGRFAQKIKQIMQQMEAAGAVKKGAS